MFERERKRKLEREKKEVGNYSLCNLFFFSFGVVLQFWGNTGNSIHTYLASLLSRNFLLLVVVFIFVF